MNKSILVINTPDCCINCEFLAFIKDYVNLELRPTCSRSEICLKKKDIYKKVNKYCPLKSLPQKNKYDVEKYATVDYENNVTLGHYLNKGWNECLNEILGEENE